MKERLSIIPNVQFLYSRPFSIVTIEIKLVIQPKQPMTPKMRILLTLSVVEDTGMRCFSSSGAKYRTVSLEEVGAGVPNDMLMIVCWKRSVK